MHFKRKHYIENDEAEHICIMLVVTVIQASDWKNIFLANIIK